MEGGGELDSEVWSCCINKRGDSKNKGLEIPISLNTGLICLFKPFALQSCEVEWEQRANGTLS